MSRFKVGDRVRSDTNPCATRGTIVFQKQSATAGAARVVVLWDDDDITIEYPATLTAHADSDAPVASPWSGKVTVGYAWKPVGGARGAIYPTKRECEDIHSDLAGRAVAIVRRVRA